MTPDRTQSARQGPPVRNNTYFIEVASAWPSVIELEITPPADGVSETITTTLPEAPQGP